MNDTPVVGYVVGQEFYVYLAYGLTWATFIGYGLSIWVRGRRGPGGALEEEQ